MAAPPDVWTCAACSYSENIDGITCQMCQIARPRSTRSVLLVDKNSTHPAAVTARGGRKPRPPPKARGVLPPRESPARGAKDRANAQMADQLGVVALAEVVHSPVSSPDSPLVRPAAAARSASAGLGNTAGDDESLDDDDDDLPSVSSRSPGRKTTGEEGALFSPPDDPETPTDKEVSRYSFFSRLQHYMDGSKITEANRAAVEVCISIEAGAAVRSMDPMKKEKKENAFYNKYMAILNEIEDDQFHDESVREAMRRRYKKAKMDNNPARLWRKYESDLTDLRNFAKKIPGVGSLSELPSGSNQLRHMKMPLVQKLWTEKHPV